MSAISDFLTQPGLWWGVPLGAIVAGTVGPIITARSVRASDARKAEQATELDDRKAQRENRQSNQKILRETATAFGEVCSGVIELALDPRAVFNAIRDAALTAGGMPDAKELEKVEFMTDLVNEAKKVTTAYNNLRVVAPKSVLDEASKLYAAIIAITQATTAPLGRPPLMQAAGLAFEAYTNSVRAELDLEPYTGEDSRGAIDDYLGALKKQVAKYLAESREQAKQSGLVDPVVGQVPVGKRLEVHEPESMPKTVIKARALGPEHIGRLVGCHDPDFDFNYGAEILDIKHDNDSANPGVLITLSHPPFPGARPARVEKGRLRFTDDLELLDLPDPE